VPTGVATPVDTVIVELPAPATEVGLNDAEAPAGSPDVENVTLPEKPLSALIVAVYDVPFPWTTVWLPGVADRLKPCTTSVTVVLWTKAPLVPVTVTV
jgi:hypothetical protein